MTIAPQAVPTKISGYLLLDKPSGPTSYDMIRWLKRVIKNVKIGHSGTLDPMASGLMILLLGPATRQQSRFMNMDKTYQGRMKLGRATSTGDALGLCIEEQPVPILTRERIETVFSRWHGSQTQIPPMYSALKKDGTPLYKLARQGMIIPRAPRQIFIHKLNLLQYRPPDEIEFRVICSSGTYVRTLVEDWSREMGTVGTLVQLCREKIGDMTIQDAVPGDKLIAMTESEIMSFIKSVPA